MDYCDVRCRQTRTGVFLLDVLVVPLFNLAEENIRNDFSRKVQGLGYRRDVVGDNNGAENRGNVQYLARRSFQVCVRHRGVRSAEVYRLRLNLLDAAARTNRL